MPLGLLFSGDGIKIYPFGCAATMTWPAILAKKFYFLVSGTFSEGYFSLLDFLGFEGMTGCALTLTLPANV